MIILKDKKYHDKAGDTIYFKEPYFDQGLRRKFHSAKEKADFLNSKNIVSNGDSDWKASKEKKAFEEENYYKKKEERK